MINASCINTSSNVGACSAESRFVRAVPPRLIVIFATIAACEQLASPAPSLSAPMPIEPATWLTMDGRTKKVIPKMTNKRAKRDLVQTVEVQFVILAGKMIMAGWLTGKMIMEIQIQIQRKPQTRIAMLKHHAQLLRITTTMHQHMLRHTIITTCQRTIWFNTTVTQAARVDHQRTNVGSTAVLHLNFLLPIPLPATICLSIPRPNIYDTDPNLRTLRIQMRKRRN